MDKIKILDRNFKKSISESKITLTINDIANRMNSELKNENPLFISILNGSFMFAADLMKRITFPCEISFVKIASYHGTTSSDEMLELIGLKENLKGRTVVIIEDIVDSGKTMSKVLEMLQNRGAGKILISTLLLKPDALRYDIKPDYVAMTIPNDFIVGYGLDYNGYGRNLPDIYTVTE
ncbi:MAG: hypoxanthine phosphoribosyltransferase [Bacteroidetes bacterium]|jgi:hypoxanthine phosphoribosyltransferase|nr:MAG: hypoxanthine phosphoribosyltransferase [Bacteroidota bacterium]